MRLSWWWVPNPLPGLHQVERVAGSPTGTTNRPAPSLFTVLVVGVYAVHSTKPLVVGTPPSSCAGGGGLSVLPISHPYQIALRLAPRRASFEQDVCCTHGEELSYHSLI
jgi:hypothetical protein